MSSRRRNKLELGHDAFLDIVANLVGILIILVVVLGSQSQTAIKEKKESQEKKDRPSQAQMEQLTQYSMQAASAQADSDRFERRIKQMDLQIDHRKRQRAALMDLLAQAEKLWEEAKKDVDEKTSKLAAQTVAFRKSKEQLGQLQGQRKALENTPDPVVAVEHLPTPMAKTVFGEEIHFRLKDNRLSIVPIAQLIKEIRRDFSRVAASANDGQMDAAVGPVRGYVARYLMQKSRQRVSRGGSINMATRIDLLRMMVEPLSEPHGQPVKEILQNPQVLDVELAGRDPATTTITVWVYPESFASFRGLKEHLYRRGYATAARPMPDGRPITGGPGGARSSAQ